MLIVVGRDQAVCSQASGDRLAKRLHSFHKLRLRARCALVTFSDRVTGIVRIAIP